MIADDAVLRREGLVRILAGAGHDVVAAVGAGPHLVTADQAFRPDLVMADVRMPPNHTDESIVAARAIRNRTPTTAVVLLSQYTTTRSTGSPNENATSGGSWPKAPPTTTSPASRTSARAVETDFGPVFAKLDLHDTPDEHRRVKAVLTYLQGSGGHTPPTRT